MKNFILFLSRVIEIPIALDDNSRRQKILDIMLLAMGLASLTILVFYLLGAVLGIDFIAAPIVAGIVLIFSIMPIVIVFTLYRINHISNNYWARLIFVGLLFFVGFVDKPVQVVNGRSLLYFSLPIITACVLLRPWAGFVMAAISSLVISYFAIFIVGIQPPFLEFLEFFLTATFLWIATQSLERHIASLRETNLALKSSEERYRALVEISPDMVVVMDKSGSLLVVNRAGLDLFGYTDLSEVVGKKLWNFVAEVDQPRAMGAMARILDRGMIKEVEYLMVRKNGATFIAEISASVLTDASNGPQAIIGLGRDITLRKKVEQELLLSKDELTHDVELRTRELRQTNRRLDDLVARSPAVIYGASVLELNLLSFVSENLFSLLGYEAGQIVDKPNAWLDLVHPEDREKFKLELREFDKAEKISREYRVLHRDGAYRWLRDEVKLIRDESGKPLELVGSWIDISQQILTEQSYQTLVESSMQGLVLLQNNKVILVNNAYTKMVGMSLEEILSLPSGKFLETIHPDDRELLLENYQERMAGRPSPMGYAIRVIHKNGQVRWLQVNPIKVTYHGEMAVQVTLMDITERVMAEQALRETRDRMEATLNALPDLLFEIDLDRRICDFRSRDMHSLYLSPELFLGKTMDDVLPPDAAATISGALDDALLNGYHRGATYDLQMPEEIHSYELSISVMGQRNSPLARFIVLVRDVTLRKKTENALRESEERYRVLGEASKDIIAIFDKNTTLVYANKFLADSLGANPEEMIGQPISSFFPPEVAERQQRNIIQALQTGLAFSVETQTPFKDKLYWWSSWMIPLFDVNGLVYSVMIVSRDISQRKATEDALQHAYASLETRVASRTADLEASHEQLRKLTRRVVSAQEDERRRIARELHDESGQVLIGLKFGLDEVLEQTPASLENVRQKITRTIDQVDELNRSIRDMAHNLRPSILDVAGINLSLGSLCREVSEQTHLTVFYSGVELLGLSDQMSITLYRFAQEALTNVARHAHAIEALVSLRRSKNFILLSVKDNGIGFDPSTTPKDIGLLGMQERLGLLNGRLEIYSRPGHGAHFKAVIPAIRSVGSAATHPVGQ